MNPYENKGNIRTFSKDVDPMELTGFYVYIHIRPDLNTPFYVGKGKGRRFKVKSGRNNHWHNIVNKNKGLFSSKILKSNLTEEEALNQERTIYNNLIKEGYNLCNIAEVGHNNGAVGCKRSYQHKLALSKATKGRISPNKGKKYGPLLEEEKYWKDKNRPQSTIKKQKISQKNRWDNNYEILKMKFRKSNGIPIIQLDLKTYKTINKFNSIIEAKEITGINTIDKCIRGEQQTAGGYLWLKKHNHNPYYYSEFSKIRIFESNLTNKLSEEEKWHQDKEDRHIEVIDGEGWSIQMDDQLPLVVSKGDRIFIHEGQVHRVLKGTTDLKIKING